jgi:hypothetical protein
LLLKTGVTASSISSNSAYVKLNFPPFLVGISTVRLAKIFGNSSFALAIAAFSLGVNVKLL